VADTRQCRFVTCRAVVTVAVTDDVLPKMGCRQRLQPLRLAELANAVPLTSATEGSTVMTSVFAAPALTVMVVENLPTSMLHR